jgi:hypothetical protein
MKKLWTERNVYNRIAAWDFYEKNKASIKWDMVVLNPPSVFGVSIIPFCFFRQQSVACLTLY